MQGHLVNLATSMNPILYAALKVPVQKRRLVLEMLFGRAKPYGCPRNGGKVMWIADQPRTLPMEQQQQQQVFPQPPIQHHQCQQYHQLPTQQNFRIMSVVPMPAGPGFIGGYSSVPTTSLPMMNFVANPLPPPINGGGTTTTMYAAPTIISSPFCHMPTMAGGGGPPVAMQIHPGLGQPVFQAPYMRAMVSVPVAIPSAPPAIFYTPPQTPFGAAAPAGPVVNTPLPPAVMMANSQQHGGIHHTWPGAPLPVFSHPTYLRTNEFGTIQALPSSSAMMGYSSTSSSNDTSTTCPPSKEQEKVSAGAPADESRTPGAERNQEVADDSAEAAGKPSTPLVSSESCSISAQAHVTTERQNAAGQDGIAGGVLLEDIPSSSCSWAHQQLLILDEEKKVVQSNARTSSSIFYTHSSLGASPPGHGVNPPPLLMAPNQAIHHAWPGAPPLQMFSQPTLRPHEFFGTLQALSSSMGYITRPCHQEEQASADETTAERNQLAAGSDAEGEPSTLVASKSPISEARTTGERHHQNVADQLEIGEAENTPSSLAYVIEEETDFQQQEEPFETLSERQADQQQQQEKKRPHFPISFLKSSTDFLDDDKKERLEGRKSSSRKRKRRAGKSLGSQMEIRAAAGSPNGSVARERELDEKRDLPETEPFEESEKSSEPRKKRHAVSSHRRSDNAIVITEKMEAKWKARLQELKKYKKENGDCMVPRGYAPDPSLGSWVNEQRKQYTLRQEGRLHHLTDERLACLRALNFEWNAQEVAWERHFNDVKDFFSQVGHCNVPKEMKALRSWIAEQRRHFRQWQQGKSSPINSTRIEKLNKINFCWNSCETSWHSKYQKLVEFHRTHKSCQVQTSHDGRLATWLREQRHQFALGTLTQERQTLLEQLGLQLSTSARRRSVSSSSEEDEDA